MKSQRSRNESGAIAASAIRVHLQALAMCLLLLLPFSASPAAAASSAATTHVYLLRGVLNIFSLGLDTIGARLEAQGIPVTVTNYLAWSSLADEAAAAYRSGRLKTIVLVGHSSGATALPDMIAKLNHLGVPVKLAIGLDSVFKTKLSSGAERYINFYVGNGPGEPVRRASGFRGKLDNVDVQSVGVGHITIDKNELIQRKVISAIDAAVFRGQRSPVAAAGARSAAAAAAVTHN